jgi:ABC-type multidrug transport system fused ATPase/permease subunit
MNNERTWIFAVLSVIVFGGLSIYLPLFDGNTDLLSLALSVNSVLFGLLTGFFITEMWDKYTSIRKESAELRGALLSMIKNMRRLQSNDKNKDLFEERMEKFLIAFIVISWENLKEEEKYFEVVTDTIGDVKPVNERDIPVYSEILDAEKVATEARSKLSALGKQGLVKIEWAILIALSSVITVSVFLLRDGSLFFNVLSTVLPSMVLLMMMLLDDLDNLRWGTSMVSFKPAEDALEELRKKKFFEKRYIENGWVEEPDVYRTEEDLEGELKEVYEDIKLKDCLRGRGILGPKL